MGCMVNGAGLAMATMDIIKLAGGSPANFLDVGGGANAEQIRNAFRILLADKEVKAVLINIFGGILRCDVLAEGVIAAVRDLGVKVPVVVRMKGNNEEKGKEMLQASGLDFTTADDMTRGGPEGGGRGGRCAVSVLVGKDTRLLVQGMGKHGTFHAMGCREYGTNVVGGVTPGKGGTTVEGFPVFDSVAEAVRKTGANVSVVFVPPPGAADAIMEAADAGIPLVVCITEGIPTLDMVKVDAFLEGRKTRLIGPNCPGIISPGEKCKVGIMPGHIHKGGAVGVVSRSGTLTYEAVASSPPSASASPPASASAATPSSAPTTLDALRLFNEDPGTEAIVMIGEIGGSAEEEAAAYVKAHVKKPVVGFIAGPDRAAGPAHGPRRRHHRGRQGHGRREDEGHGRRGHPRGQVARPTSGAAVAKVLKK